MIATLRQLAARPIAGGLRTFATIAAVLVLVAAGLLLTSPGPTVPEQPTASVARPSGVAQIAPAAPTATQPITAVRARQIARRFLTGYLEYLYGHGTATQLHAATDDLRRRLAEHPPRISPAMKHRHPRVRRLVVGSEEQVGRRVTATIADGGVHFPIGVSLTRTAAGSVLVDDVLEDR